MRHVVAKTAVVSTACVLPAFLIGAMAVQVRRDTGIEAVGIGLAFAVFFTTAALASAPGGRLADRRDPVLIARLAAAVSGLMSLVVAALGSFATIVVCFAIAGAANAVCQSAANLIIVRALPAHRHGFALAVKQSAIPGAALLAGIAVPALAVTVGWRWAYAVGAGMAFAAVLWLRGASSPPASRHRSLGAERTAPAAGSAVPARLLVLLALAVGLGGTAASSLGAFLVLAAVDTGISESAAGLLLVASSVAGISVRLIAGARADRRGGGHFRVVALMFAGGAISFALLAVGVPVAYLVGGPLAFCTAWAWPGLFNLAVVTANPGRPASAIGITQTGQFVAGVVGPLLFGLIADQAGYRPAWVTACVLALFAAVILTTVRTRIEQEPAAEVG